MNYFSSSYKKAGANAVDATGELDTVEFLNIAKDDALAWPKQARREYPRTVSARMENTISPFVRKSLEVNNTILEVFNDRLGLSSGTLLKLHPMDEYSGSEARVIRNPPTPQGAKQAIGSHTDFGSLVHLCTKTIFKAGLHVSSVVLAQSTGRSSGFRSRGRIMAICQGLIDFLHVMMQVSSRYLLQPIPGHAICNLGDAMAIFSGGILRSNLHRVL